MGKIKTMFKITIPDRRALTIPLTYQQDAAHKVWVDWGDKSYPDTYSYQGLIEAEHTYSMPGDYYISMYAVDDGTIVLGGGWTSGNAVGGKDEAVARMLERVIIGEDVTGIADYAFRGCENLAQIEFPANQEVTIGVMAFEGCCSLESFEVPKNIAILEAGMFSNCTSLKKVTLPTGLYKIERFAFANCVQLREVNLLPPTHIGDHAFAGCRMLREVKLGPNCQTIGEGAFDSCSNLRSLTLGSAKQIGNDAFHNAKSLYEVTLPAMVEHVGQRAFGGCTSLTTIKMEATEPPTLADINAIEQNDGLRIVVPVESRRKYAQDTNWTVFADAM